jgi:DNA-binding response OmpR family regulator
MRILLVEDDPKISLCIKIRLEKFGFTIDNATDSFNGEMLAQTNNYDLIILDIVIPGISGFELCKKIRNNHNNIPILMLTSLDSVEDKVTGFDCGADDYLTKPFDFDELLARIKALNRRKKSIDVTFIIKVLDLELNSQSKKVIRNNHEIILTATEFKILELFMSNKNKILSKIHIAEQIWGYSYNDTKVLDVHISSLRYKINKDCNNKLLHTRRGIGYVLSEDLEN